MVVFLESLPSHRPTLSFRVSMIAHRRSVRLSIAIVGMWLIAGCGRNRDGNTQANSQPTAREAVEAQRSGDFVQRARRMLEIGDFESAAESASQALLQNPELDDAKLIASEIEAARGNHQSSFELAASIDIQSRFGRRATEIQIEQLLELDRPSKAADAILTIVGAFPLDDDRVTGLRRQAWELLNRVGRRQEASWQAELLCRAGKANLTEMLSLARRNEAFPYTLPPRENPEQYFEPGLGMAKWHSARREFRLALQELSPVAEAGYDSPAACAMYGRLLAESQMFDGFPTWHSTCGPNAREFSDYWVALGTYFLDQHQYEASARALLEAAIRDPTDFTCVHRLAKVFEALDQPEKREQFRHRGALLFQVQSIVTESPQSGEQVVELSRSSELPPLLLQLGRPFEALGWRLLNIPDTEVSTRAAVTQKLAQLSRDPDAIGMASKMTLVGIDLNQFSAEVALDLLRRSSPPKVPAATHADQLALPRLVNVAAGVGLEFQWYQDVENNLASIPLHELMGGGIAVVDYDLDGWPDLYVAQGAGEPPTEACIRSNVLFRNFGGQFEAVTNVAGADDFNYSSGLAAGDVNQDGFTDLLLGSLGRNRLLINNGDGTFRDSTNSWGEMEDRFTSSLAIADINSDSLPDLFEGIYVEMKGGFKQPEAGEDGFPRQPSPIVHYAQSDRWFENKGDGTFQSREISRDVASPGTSLGVVVTDFDGDGSNEIFVGNDARSNHFLVQAGNGKFINSAGVRGIASGFSGEPEACMGIATGDFDRDGSLDLHVTNYSKESANHYLQSPGGVFRDLAIRYGIDRLTFPYIGFGTKAVDVDRNGWLDLILTNGHVFDLRREGEEFQMPPQLLVNLGDRFEAVSVEDDSGYWDGFYLGRSIAMIDFDRDGALDFLIGHLHEPLALLNNQTRTSGRWIQFELVGTASERDAIGARVTVTTLDGQQFTQWVTAGDGYLCADEPVIDFGLGEVHDLDKIEVRWPSGQMQVFRDLEFANRYLVVEGEPSVHLR